MNTLKIVNHIQKYYADTFKNAFLLLNMCSQKDLNLLLSFFNTPVLENNEVSKKYLQEFKKFNSTLGVILEKSLDINIESLKEKIDIFFLDILFPMVNKKEFVMPEHVLNHDLLTKNVYKSFLKNILYKSILIIIDEMITNVLFYKKKLQTNVFFSASQELINKMFYQEQTYLGFYHKLLNKYDSGSDYIFPIYNYTKGNIHFSKIIYDKEKGGAFDEDLGVEKIKTQLDNLFVNSNNVIKNVYDKEKIKRLEELLDNTKINNLINNKQLKLKPGFNSIIKKILEKEEEKDNDNNHESMAQQDLKKKYFNDIFELDKGQKITNEDIYKIYKEEPDKEQFIKYIVDKTMHNNLLSQKKNSEELKITSLIDDIFNHILKTDYDHNSLNLQDDDVKFILMLETLNSIKTSSIGNSSNITVNLYKEIDGAKINKDEISFN